MRAREAALAAAIATLDADRQALLMQACGLIDDLAASLDGAPRP